MSLSFAQPQWLWLLAAVAALLVGYGLAQRRRTRYTITLTTLDLLASVMPRRPDWRRHIPPALVLLGLSALTLGLADPVRQTPAPGHQSVIVLAVDVSPSMQATDVPPNRTAAMTAAVGSFLDELDPQVHVGLVSFAATARIEVTPTLDHTAVADRLDRLQPRSNTSLAQAILTSLNAVQGSDAALPAGIVLLSDGNSNVGPPVAEAITAARADRVPVSTIALGTPTGTITLESGRIEVPVDNAELTRIAADTGGLSFDAANQADLHTIYRSIGDAAARPLITESLRVWFAAAAFALTALGAALSLIWFARLP
jgi:Ca-activated chloride channel family protein